MEQKSNENESYIIYNLKTKEVIEDHLKPMSEHALHSAARRIVDIIMDEQRKELEELKNQEKNS